MSGIAIIIDGANFANSGLGRVTRKGDTPTPPEGLIVDGLIANFDAYNAESATLVDSVSGEMSAQLNGSVGRNCIDINPTLDGNTHSGADFEKILNGLSTWTVEMVLYAPGWADSANIARDIIHEVGSAESNRICVFLGSNNNHTNGEVDIRYKNSWVVAPFDNDTISSIDWTKPHVIHITRESSSTAQEFKLYIDGTLLATAQTTAVGTAATVASRTVYLASKGERSLYAMRFYNRAILPAEASHNFEYNNERYSLNINI